MVSGDPPLPTSLLALIAVSAIFVVMVWFFLKDMLPERLQYSRPLSRYLWARRQSRRGNARACIDCADMLEKGTGGAPHNPAAARAYVERALEIYRPQAKRGDGLAWLKMAEIHNRHHKVQTYTGVDDRADRCYHKAWKIFMRQAEDGDPNACAYLGYQYRFGLGVPGDLETAAAYLEKAAEAGHAPSMKSLADLYLMGFKTKPDPGKAATLYRQAALGGDIESIERVGDTYAATVGEPADRELAYFWYVHALKKGREAVRPKLKWLEDNWTPKQLRDIQTRLRDWAPG